jgi:hypothetical protein
MYLFLKIFKSKMHFFNERCINFWKYLKCAKIIYLRSIFSIIIILFTKFDFKVFKKIPKIYQNSGTFRPHARITTCASDSSGERIVIGGQDGSLLTAFLYDEKVHPEAQRSLASLPSRKYLAELLGIAVSFWNFRGVFWS